MREWSNLAKIVTRRTYSRTDNPLTNGSPENWNQIIEREVMGNVKGRNVSKEEVNHLLRLGKDRKAIPAGRGLWFSGTDAHARLGGVALNNCWTMTADHWNNFVIIADLLMLGGGVGSSVEHRYVSKLPRVKKDVRVIHKATNDADYIIPDSREGWCKAISRALEAFFVTGKSFTYSTVCLRGKGEPIKSFGGVSSGPIPLIQFFDNLNIILGGRSGKHIRPIDAADIITATGEVVVSGNVRRSAILLMGDAWDKEFLTAKRWDLGTLPSYRSCANYSVVCEDADDLHPLFWKTFEAGEAYGIVNRKAIQKFGRIGELKKDSAEGTNPCAEATLEPFEPCVAEDTPLITSTGLAKISDLANTSTYVWNGENWSKVIVRKTGTNRELFRVNFSDGSYLDCTANHSFSVKTKLDKQYQKKKISNIELDDRYPVRLQSYKMKNLNKTEYSNSYTLGVAVGDGWIDCGNVYVGLYKTASLPVVGKRYKPYLKEDHNSPCIRVRTNIDYYDFCAIRGGDYSDLFTWDRKSVLEFIAGWMDADGTETASGTCRLYISQIHRARTIQMLLSLQGIKSTVCTASKSGTVTNKGIRKHDLCYLSISDCSEIPCYRVNTSKGHKPSKRGRGVNVTIKSVEKLEGLHDVYCFSEHEKHMAVFSNVLTYQCNLQEIALPNIESEDEFILAARLMHRYGKRATMEKFHHEQIQEVVNRNRRVGTGITGCLASPLFDPRVLDRAYQAIQEENVSYSKELGIPESIRTTVIKPSGTVSKVLDMDGYEGIHPAYSRYIIQRVRFAANDPLIPLLREARHYMEPVRKLDGTMDLNTLVVDFYVQAPAGSPVADENYSTWDQLKDVQMAQRHWADQSVSVSVYYKREDISKIKTWLADNIKNLKTISFLAHAEHGFAQAPKEKITAEQFEKLSSDIKPIDFERIGSGDIDSGDCATGVCPVK